MNDSEVTEFTIAWESIQELEGQQRTTEEKIQKLTKLIHLLCEGRYPPYPNKQDYHHIHAGNGIAHHGNCVRDSHLYEAGGRGDLYGFDVGSSHTSDEYGGIKPNWCHGNEEQTGEASQLPKHSTKRLSRVCPYTLCVMVKLSTYPESWIQNQQYGA